MTQRAEAALRLMQQYLLDAVEPAVAADAVATLMAQPPEVLMRPVGDWSVGVASRTGRPVSDLLLYALQKIYITGELGLLDSEAVAGYLDRLTSVALRIVPVEQRDQLRSNLATMRMSRTRTAARVDMPIERLELHGFRRWRTFPCRSLMKTRRWRSASR